MQTQQKHVTQKQTIQHNNNQNYNIFKSHVTNNSMSYTKTLGFVGDILAVREKIFQRIRSTSNNKTSS